MSDAMARIAELRERRDDAVAWWSQVGRHPLSVLNESDLELRNIGRDSLPAVLDLLEALIREREAIEHWDAPRPESLATEAALRRFAGGAE